MSLSLLRAVLYSDQIIPENTKVDRRLLELLSGGRRIAYVASGPEPDRRFFDGRKNYYATCGLELSVFFDLYEAAEDRVLEELFGCDAIHLTGGHTAGFLKRMRKSGLSERFVEWARAGGLLIGTSAGAILMTPSIAVDALFSGAVPEAHPELAGFGLLPFEFFPHLGKKASFLPALVAYSRKSPRPILACADGDGAVVANGLVEPIGELLWIEKGEARPAEAVRLADLVE